MATFSEVRELPIFRRWANESQAGKMNVKMLQTDIDKTHTTKTVSIIFSCERPGDRSTIDSRLVSFFSIPIGCNCDANTKSPCEIRGLANEVSESARPMVSIGTTSNMCGQSRLLPKSRESKSGWIHRSARDRNSGTRIGCKTGRGEFITPIFC